MHCDDLPGFGLSSLAARRDRRARAVGHVSVYFRKDAAIDRVRHLADGVRERPGVGRVTVIPADEALETFRKDSGFGTAVDALTDNPLPHALDVRPAADAATPAHLEDLKRPWRPGRGRSVRGKTRGCSADECHLDLFELVSGGRAARRRGHRGHRHTVRLEI